MRVLLCTLLLLFSCADQTKTQDLVNEIFIGQPGVVGFNLDNIEINYNEVLTSRKLFKDEVFVSTSFVLSKIDGVNPRITISGAYNEPLSQDDLNALATFGITSVDQTSTKGEMKGMSKNPTRDPDLAYNIIVSATIFGNEELNLVIAGLKTGFIYTGGENHFNAEVLTRVSDEDYFLFHEFQTNQLSAYQRLPESNLRKIPLGTPVANTEISEIKFSDDLSLVNDYQVGYAFSSEVGKPIFKVTNDGSGINGWQFTEMSSGFDVDRWFETIPVQANGEAVLLTATKQGNNNGFMTIAEWSGTNWIFTDLGASAKTAVGGTWVDANTYHSRPFKASNGSIWFALNEGSSVINESDPLKPHPLVNGYLIGMEYISGDPKVITNWQITRHDFGNIGNVIQSRIYTLFLSNYIDANDFRGFIAGDGMIKVDINGIDTRFEAVARFQGSNFLDTNQEFPESVSGEIQNIKYIYNIVNVPQNSFELLCQGPNSIFKLDVRDNSISDVLVNTVGSVVRYSR